MSDPQNTHDGSSDEATMVPHELVGRQISDDPVPNDPEATGPADEDADADAGGEPGSGGQDV